MQWGFYCFTHGLELIQASSLHEADEKFHSVPGCEYEKLFVPGEWDYKKWLLEHGNDHK